MLVIFSLAGHSQTIRTVVLDAGHGGKDPGTVNGRNYEKTINLAVIKAAGAILDKNPAINVVYTRTDDRFVELSERSRIAAEAKADLFVSVHTNASPNKKASGTETYIMGIDKGNANLEVAMRENGVISLESDYSTAYEGYDPSSSESLIMFSLMQYSFSRESLELASAIQKRYKASGRRDNGVRQAGFLVLWRNAMPSVLTELGYLSNEVESQYLLSKAGQAELARGIAQSVESYIKSCDENKIRPANDRTEVKVAKVDPKPTTAPKPAPAPSVAPVVIPVAAPVVAATPIKIPAAAPPPAPAAKNPKVEPSKSTEKSTEKSIQKPTENCDDELIEPRIVGKSEQSDRNLIIDGPAAHYSIQVRSTRDRVSINSSNFGPLVMQIVERKTEKYYKYTIGSLIFYKDALLLQDKIRRLYPDAFIVAFTAKGEQISVTDARKMIENN